MLMSLQVRGVGLDTTAAHGIDGREWIVNAKQVMACRQGTGVPDYGMQALEITLLQTRWPAPFLQRAGPAGMAKHRNARRARCGMGTQAVAPPIEVSF